MTLPATSIPYAESALDAAAAPLRPARPADLTFLPAKLTDHSSESLAESGRSIIRTILSAWVDAAADAVLNAMLTDIRAGVIPSPQQRPHDVESALAARAEEAAALHPDLTSWSCGRGMPDILAFAACGLGARYGTWRTSPTPFVRLTVRSADTEPTMGQGDAGAVGLCVLRPGDRHGAADIGFEVVIDWEAFARRVLRDDILHEVARRAEGQKELLLTIEFTGGPRTMPCRVRTAVPQAESLPGSDRRRRRR